MVFPFHHITKSAEETKELGALLGSYFLKGDSHSTILCCWGDLGSGKTTFIQGLAQGLGISKRLLSPTFIIVRHYEVAPKKRLYHFDLYRFGTEKDIDTVGLSEILEQPNTFVCIEWPERLGSQLPKARIDAKFRANLDGTHTIDIMKI